MRDLKLKPEYSSSHALIIGINDYKHASPLNHAVEDATAIAAAIQKSFGFQSENVKLLLDTAATKANILSTYFGYEKTAEPDSRLLIFFAGHGITKAGRYRDAGFLVPCDGNDHDLSTLIGWEELTRNADLIPSKHVFFVMDACYGGLVFNRAIGAGGVRFLKDMLIRPARQALTAGKQDEAVSDGGGPRPMHSVFTGHFLNGLEGAARAPEGHLTASGIMSYVYKQVANDIHSEQTPHYGFLSGDGDFIFDAPQLETLAPSDTSESDTLVTVSALEIPEEEIAPSGPIAVAKQILSDPKRGIQLHDLVAKYTRKLILETSKEQFPVQNVSFSPEELARRLRAYENVTQDL
ncbi:MAG TPA: caspase family protein, partial [Verrucomicrobiae bacterium]|nr:caspase family protein [Verrucomicrobiae bacterium]